MDFQRNYLNKEIIQEAMMLFLLEIYTQTLKNVLNIYLPKEQIIDFLSIDVEGLDFDVIKSVDLNKVRPRLILIEILSSSYHE